MSKLKGIPLEISNDEDRKILDKIIMEKMKIPFSITLKNKYIHHDSGHVIKENDKYFITEFTTMSIVEEGLNE